MPQLTFTRYVAALIVVLFHFGADAFLWLGWWLAVLRQGPTMVTYFFVLSGFLLATRYGDGDDDQGSGWHRSFWVARFARIYPTCLLALGLMVLVLTSVDHSVAPTTVLLHGTLLQAWFPGRLHQLNYPAWSLSVEAFFYALFPFVIGRFQPMPTWRLIGLALALWLVSAVVAQLADGLPSGTSDFWQYNPLFHLNAFVVGVVAAIVVKRHGRAIRGWLALERGGALAAWLGMVIATTALFAAYYALAPATGLRFATDRGLLAPLFAVLIVALALDRSWLSRLLANRPFVLLGEASYAVYILQVPLWALYEPLIAGYAMSPDVVFLVFAAGLTAVAIAVHLWFERPLRAWTRRSFAIDNRHRPHLNKA